MFFARVARFAIQPLTVVSRLLLVIAVLLAAACLGWLKHSAAIVQNSAATIVSAAGNEADALAPDSLATAYGERLATQTDIAATPQTSLAGTTVTVAGIAAKLLFASPGQINFLIPAGTQPGSATVRISAADGAVSEGTINISPVAPAIFTVGGVASGFALRVKADGAQSYEPVAEFDTAGGQFKPKAIDLNSDAGDQVFLVFFLSGLRNADPAQVRVILGGDEFAPVFAGAVPGAAGLDQINLLLPRELTGKGDLNLVVKAPNARLSNSAKIQIGGGASTLAISKLSKQTVVAGETLEIEGTNMPTSNVEVLFEPGVGVAPETVTPTKMTLRVPFGVATGAVKISVNKQIAYVSPQPLNVTTSVSGFVQEFKDGKRVAIVGLPICLIQEQNGPCIPGITNSAGAFLIPNVAVSTSSTITINGVAANGLGYSHPGIKVRVYGNRDNQASSEDAPLLVELKPNGTVTTSFAAADTPLNERLQVAAAIPNETAGVITSGQVTFDTGNSTITCPGGASGCQLALNVFDPGRTPTNLPAGVFSSTIAQITPFGATLTPGGKLIFPNSDANPAGTPLRLYRYDQTPTSATFGQFVDIGPGIISSDGQRLETTANAVTQASYYLISRQWRLMATIIGHVVEADGVRPVRRAVVSARGQSTFTDGNGGFVLRNIPVIKANDTVTLEVSFHRADGTVTRTERAGVAISTGAQVTLPTNISLPQTLANSGPAILAPTTLSLTEGETREFNFLVTGLAGVQPTLTDRPLSASLRSLGNEAFALRLVAPPSSAGNYQVTIEATAQNKTSRQSVAVTVVAANVNTPIAKSDAVTTDEDTPVNITLASANAGGSPVYTITTQPLHGSLSRTPPNLTYTPAADYNGVDSFGFKVRNGNVESGIVVFSIAVRPVNDLPVITSTFVNQVIDAGQEIKLRLTASDPDGDSLICNLLDTLAGASIAPVANLSNTWLFEWTPLVTQTGPLAVGFEVRDGQGRAMGAIPITVVAKWAKTSGPEGGNMQSLFFDGPVLYAGMLREGAFFSTDQGMSWTQASNGLPLNTRVSAIAASGGKVFISTDSLDRITNTITYGVYRSDNKGQSWTLSNTGLPSAAIECLWADQTGAIYAGGISGVYVSYNQGQSWTGANNGLSQSGRVLTVNTLTSSGSNLFAGTETAGLFLSTNQGGLWRAVGNGFPSGISVISLAAFGNTIFAGTTNGIYRSLNQGASWSLANSGIPQFSNNGFRLAIAEQNVCVGLFGNGTTSDNGVYCSTNNGGSWQKRDNGLSADIEINSLAAYKSTFVAGTRNNTYLSTNAGQSWNIVNTGITAREINTLAALGQNLFAGTNTNGVYRSVNQGQSWISTTLTSSSIVTLSAAGSTLYAAIPNGLMVSRDGGVTWAPDTSRLPSDLRALVVNGNAWFAACSGQIYRSDNQGQSWTLKFQAPGLSTIFNSIVLRNGSLIAGASGTTSVNKSFRSLDGDKWEPGQLFENVTSLVALGNNVYAATTTGVYRSLDLGITWSPVNNGLPTNGGIARKVDRLAVLGSNLYAGSLSGVFISGNQGQNWTPITIGLTNTYVRSFLESNSSLYLGTYGGSVFRLGSAIQSWNEGNGNLSSKAIYALTIKNGVYLAGTLGGGVYRSADQGATWLAANNGLPPSPVIQSIVSGSRSLLTAVQEQGVYRLTDDSTNWVALNNGLPNLPGSQQNPRNVNALGVNGATVLAATDGGVFRLGDVSGNWVAANLTRRVSSLLVNGATAFAGTLDDGVYRSADDGRTWQSLSKLGLSNLSVRALGLSANGASLFAGTDAGIYRSDDGGGTWRAVNRDLPSNLVVTSFQTSGAKLYAGSVYGVFLSEDNGENWKQINAGLLDIYVTSFALDGDKLIAGTKVGGVFISQIPDQPACIGIAAQPVSKTISNGQSTTLTVTPSGNQPFQFQWYQGASGDFSKPIAGATGNTFATSSLTATTNYWVLVTNNCGSANSETVSVVINAVPQTDLAITQTISPAQPKPGDTLTFTFTLTNRGSEKALAVNVTNPLPVEVEFTACSATGGGVCSSRTNNQTVFFAEMVGNASATITLTAKVKADAGGKTLRNNASVSAATNDANLSNNSDPKTVTVQQTAPVISGLNPTTAIVGGAGFTLTVNGSNFVSGAKVRWNGTERGTVFISATQLTAQIPGGDIAAIGTAMVMVANPDGQISNSVAFSVTAPPRQNSILRVVGSTGSVGSTVAVLIELVSQGDENALGFSLTFDPTILSNPQTALGSGASGATLNPNLSQAAAGRLGVVLAMPSGQRFAAGVRQIAVITFTIAANTSAAVANLEFGNQPIPREIADVNANELGATYTGGTVTITRGFEADVAPRPNGNGVLSVTDWVLVGRFASGDLAVDAGSEFQRTDCAPRSSFGNGAITVSDWVQAGRYAAG
ncbi:MAG TPA: Ig-like domain-containing protein, partial [Blastocatellia bacterium]|nr:Ig-like domain-containing protein [Blastocatellia bacterium]